MVKQYLINKLDPGMSCQLWIQLNNTFMLKQAQNTFNQNAQVLQSHCATHV